MRRKHQFERQNTQNHSFKPKTRMTLGELLFGSTVLYCLNAQSALMVTCPFLKIEEQVSFGSPISVLGDCLVGVRLVRRLTPESSQVAPLLCRAVRSSLQLATAQRVTELLESMWCRWCRVGTLLVSSSSPQRNVRAVSQDARSNGAIFESARSEVVPLVVATSLRQPLLPSTSSCASSVALCVTLAYGLPENTALTTFCAGLQVRRHDFFVFPRRSVGSILGVVSATVRLSSDSDQGEGSLDQRRPCVEMVWLLTTQFGDDSVVGAIVATRVRVECAVAPIDGDVAAEQVRRRFVVHVSERIECCFALVCFRPEPALESSLLQFSRVGTGALIARSEMAFVPNSLSREYCSPRWLLAAVIAAPLARSPSGEQPTETLWRFVDAASLVIAIGCVSSVDDHPTLLPFETGDETSNRVLRAVDAALSLVPFVHVPLTGACSIVPSPFRATNVALVSRPSGRAATSVRSIRKSPMFRAVETRIVDLLIDFSNICIYNNNNNNNYSVSKIPRVERGKSDIRSAASVVDDTLRWRSMTRRSRSSTRQTVVCCRASSLS